MVEHSLCTGSRKIDPFIDMLGDFPLNGFSVHSGMSSMARKKLMERLTLVFQYPDFVFTPNRTFVELSEDGCCCS